eukprot:gene1136-1240_t
MHLPELVAGTAVPPPVEDAVQAVLEKAEEENELASLPAFRNASKRYVPPPVGMKQFNPDFCLSDDHSLAGSISPSEEHGEIRMRIDGDPTLQTMSGVVIMDDY